MKKIYVPTSSIDDWRKLLADPEKHWRKGYSAMELAKCWERANKWPDCIDTIFKQSNYKVFHTLECLFAFPEYKVSLPGGIRASQNDLYVIAKSSAGLMTIMIEAKVNEAFGDKTIQEWLKNASSGKIERYNYLCSILNIKLTQPDEKRIRYQLLHRTACAIIEAEKIEAKHALMLVQSFSKDNASFDQYSKFVSLFSISPKTNQILKASRIGGIELFLGWVNCSK